MGSVEKFFYVVLLALGCYLLHISNSNNLPNYAKFTSWSPQPAPQPSSLQQNVLGKAKKYFEGDIYLPEATVVDQNGKFYVSSGNGSILSIDPKKPSYKMEVHTGGRPLGMSWAKDGRLLVADSLLGLLAIDLNTKRIEILCNHVNGRPVRFANAVTTASDGTIYFTDSSDIPPVQMDNGFFNTHHTAILQILVASPTGRVIKYDPKSNKAEVILEGDLSFANGIALSKDESFFIVSDLGHHCVKRFWLKGPKTGTYEIVLDNLPGFPDNIGAASDGGFYISLASTRSPVIDFLHPYAFLKQMLLSFPLALFPKPPDRKSVV